ncbi:MAG: serine acetyltransferase [Lentisphaerae bacterium]|nr:serine acetyltransferase [Lentisphaerota bacterium]
MSKTLPGIVNTLMRCINCQVGVSAKKRFNLASQKTVRMVVEEFMSILFPGCHGPATMIGRRRQRRYGARLRAAAVLLAKQVENALRYQCELEKCADCRDCREKAEKAVMTLVESLPAIHELLQRDIQAAYEGDPAARSLMEIVLSYPGLQAIAVHRIAHVLYQQRVPLIPRIMAEQAHSNTGIDIHPGAQIGGGFFIDHGTGVVIGETCVIGENVKLYQGVTLGALSFPKDEHGKPIKGIKRHPEVRANATIYAGATILGGDTIVGEGAVIGGNVWLTHSVPPGAKVYNLQPGPSIQMVE